MRRPDRSFRPTLSDASLDRRAVPVGPLWTPVPGPAFPPELFGALPPDTTTNPEAPPYDPTTPTQGGVD